MFNAFIRGYWEYYRELEDEFLVTRRYVAFDEENYSVYSIEYLKLYQAVCGEVDTLGKEIAHMVNEEFKPDDKQNNILKWWFEIQSGNWLAAKLDGQSEVAGFDSPLSSASCTFLGRHEIVPWDGYETEWLLDKKIEGGVALFRAKLFLLGGVLITTLNTIVRVSAQDQGRRTIRKRIWAI